MISPTIPEETRRLFLAAMEAEASGHTHFAKALKALLRQNLSPVATWTLKGPQTGWKGIQ